MLIWDYIRDFLVQYIFGGFDSLGNSYGCQVGFFTNNSFEYDSASTSDLYVNIGDVGLNNNLEGIFQYITLGDWLSTTCTIIIMCLIVVLFALLVRWVFKTVVSAFLLK